MLRALGRIPLVAVLAVAGLLAAAPPASAATHHYSRVISSDFADPGFAKFGSFYYLYKTGPSFGVSMSVSPQSGYGPIATSMPHIPAWVGKDPSGARKLWAPHVIGMMHNGHALYVMYFTGYYPAKKANCIGVATSSSPDRNFAARSTPTVCAAQAGYEAIDPSAYHAADGKRYLIYKVNYRNVSGFDIRAVQMDSATGTVRVAGVASRSKIAPGSRMEAPSVISHGGQVFIFTSRGNWADCTYSTDVWVAPTFWNGSFHRVRTVMSSSSTGLCGPGGATVINDGSTTRLAFHAWKGGSASSKVRQAYVGVLKWTSSNVPYLY